MTFPWVDYLTVAEALVQQRSTFAPEEACCRASISRAYYAVFCAARNYAVAAEGLQLGGTGGDHQQVQRHFQHGPRPEHRTLGTTLARLRRARNRADYANTMSQVVRQAQEAVEHARRGFGALEALQLTVRPNLEVNPELR